MFFSFMYLSSCNYALDGLVLPPAHTVCAYPSLKNATSVPRHLPSASNYRYFCLLTIVYISPPLEIAKFRQLLFKYILNIPEYEEYDLL